MRAHRKRSGRLSVAGLCLLFAVLLAGMAIGAVLHAIHPLGYTTFARPAGYTASALIRVALRQDSVLSSDESSNISLEEYKIYRNTQACMLKSPRVLIAALRKSKIAGLSIVKRESDPLAWLEKKLNVSFLGGDENLSEIMRVSITSKKAEEAKELVGAVVDAYISEIVNKENDERKLLASKLTQIYNSKENEVRTKRANLINLAEQLNAPHSEAGETQSAVSIRKLYDLRAALIRMQMKLGEAKGALKAGQAMLERLDDAPVSEIELEKLVRADPICKQHSEMIAGLRPAVGRKNQKDQPDVKKDSVERRARQLKGLEKEYEIRENELRELIKGTKRAEIEEKIAAAQVQVKILTEQEAALSAQVEAQREKGKIGKRSVDIEMMTSELASLEKILAEIRAQRERLNIESRARPRITRLSDAYLESN